jgi:hypothetical protein
MYVGTQICHKEFIKKIAGGKISPPCGNTTGEKRKNAWIFARDMQSLDEVWYIYPLFWLAGLALQKLPWVHSRIRSVSWSLPKIATISPDGFKKLQKRSHAGQEFDGNHSAFLAPASGHLLLD